MNEYEIDEAIDLLTRVDSPLAPYARYLGSWRDIINSNSDGWPYWKVGHHAANRLSEMLNCAVNYHRGHGSAEPDVDDARKAISSIKAAATRHGLPQPSADGV
jgi:hypothetical protein